MYRWFVENKSYQRKVFVLLKTSRYHWNILSTSPFRIKVFCWLVMQRCHFLENTVFVRSALFSFSVPTSPPAALLWGTFSMFLYRSPRLRRTVAEPFTDAVCFTV